jgi:hypothetical protein
METNDYIKNEIKLLKMVEQLKFEKNKLNSLKLDEGARDYIIEFSVDQVNKIKDILKN